MEVENNVISELWNGSGIDFNRNAGLDKLDQVEFIIWQLDGSMCIKNEHLEISSIFSGPDREYL